ncbi:hypothetical protein CJA_2871 [Cellvibrio japonicus Ueda107]|uniref:Uncharacterized protein n=1 Tax=Cellvibrio japonicus (strain Ueda107) TaxID=498211 RepID=B3PC56_CELJU|nr:hypothetical protein CJA_2871 [Cellvibrio japonicus Ueda107]
MLCQLPGLSEKRCIHHRVHAPIDVQSTTTFSGNFPDSVFCYCQTVLFLLLVVAMLTTP